MKIELEVKLLKTSNGRGGERYLKKNLNFIKKILELFGYSVEISDAVCYD
ncbi:MAG: hypothetical protein J6S85_19485 [Methanobrevibacter sp.]|nr:hypothetical protein [Methanobrevibacter sp.]